MTRRLSLFIFRLPSIIAGLLGESLRFLRGMVQPQAFLVAENLFLRKQLAFYRERNILPRRLTDTGRLSLVLLSRWFDWKNTLVVVKPETFIGWHRRAFQLFWRWKSRGGRPRLPRNLRTLIAEMVRENPTWGESRIASELSLKLGVRVSPRTVRAYSPENLIPSRGPSSQRWMTFVRNHARAIVACDFVVAVTLRFRILYVFVVMEVGSRRILHVNVTAHPTSSWTWQQLREAIPSDHEYRWLIHDRSGIFSEELERIRSRCAQDSRPSAKGQRVLREADRQFAAGVLGLVHSVERATSAQAGPRMGRSLQPGKATQEFRTRDSRCSAGAADSLAESRT
jgi:putative transposase